MVKNKSSTNPTIKQTDVAHIHTRTYTFTDTHHTYTCAHAHTEIHHTHLVLINLLEKKTVKLASLPWYCLLCAENSAADKTLTAFIPTQHPTTQAN